ncbi:retrovirus-related pol polyprotein from transposon TNT 1-94 [Tanacetum coccineum]|uniref:Retrovirus-related pol polyprotein from transposon TNT 1-94 n=1 Tax=Tanacetum coccineum TaxID=301880 RepID=A0ABQ4WJ19_9ASTR
MLAPKCSTFNGRPTFANPMYHKKAQYDPATRLILDSEEILTLADESRSKLNKDLVKPFDYTKLNSLYEIFKPPTQHYEIQFAQANEIRKKMWRKSFVKTKPNVFKNIDFLPVSKSVSKSRQAYNVMTNNINHLSELVNQAWVKHSNDHLYLRHPTAQDMEILVKKCLMPLALKTQNDSLAFIHELKKEMHAYLKIEKQLQLFEIALQECQVQLKNDKVCKEKASNVFRKEREQYVEIQDLKAQLQDKNMAISELKKLVAKCKGKSVDTKFDKPSVVRQPNAQRLPKPSVLGKPAPFSNSLERQYFAKKKSVLKTNESESLSKPVTLQNLPKTAMKAVRNTNVIKPGMYRIASSTTQTRAPQLNQTFRNTNPRASTSTGIAHKTNVSRPQPRSNQMKDKVVPYTSHAKLKKTEVEEHPRISSISNKTKSVTAACNEQTKKPNVVPISTRKPKRQANKSVATPHKKTVASESTTTSSKSYYRMLYQKTSKAWKWWIAQQCPSSYTWVPKTQKKWVPRTQKKWVPKTQKQWTGQCITAVQFVTKLSSLFALAMINFAPILGYGDLIQGIFIHIRTVVYLLRRTHSSASFPVGQFCDAELGALVISVRTEFLKQPLNASLKKQEFEHKILSTPRTPEQNGVVERRNRTLVEAARTMLSASKLPLFFWAEAIATACYTQNRSIIIPTHEKTDSHFNEEKWDSCILVGYSHLSQRDIVYSTNNKAEVKSIHLSIDESKRISETSPDIVQALCYCARYQARPTEKHRKRGIKGLSILKEVHSHGLWYPEGDKLVNWMSKNQDCTAMSSAKAEYVALSASLISNEMRTPLQEYCINYNKIPL